MFCYFVMQVSYYSLIIDGHYAWDLQTHYTSLEIPYRPNNHFDVDLSVVRLQQSPFEVVLGTGVIETCMTHP